MARIRGYIAASLDGFIATPDGGLDWLTKYENVDLGEASYERFIAGIRTIVMGRGTYDFVAGAATEWPYADRRTIVVTSRPLPDPRGPIEVWATGVDTLVAHLRGLEDGDVWMAGGGALQMAFIERGGLDELDVTVMPELIGGGIPLFPPTGFATSPELISARALDLGCVHLRYRFAESPSNRDLRPK